MWILPETPIWLAEKDRLDEALASLAWLRNNEVNILSSPPYFMSLTMIRRLERRSRSWRRSVRDGQAMHHSKKNFWQRFKC